MTNLIKRLSASCYLAFEDGTNDYSAAQEAIDRIEELVKEVERRIEPEQVENLVKMADPIMSELYAVEYSCRQEAEAKLAKAVEWFKKLDRRGDALETFDPVVHEVVTAALAELEKE